MNLEQCSKQSKCEKETLKNWVGRDCEVSWFSLCSKQGLFQLEMRLLRASPGWVFKPPWKDGFPASLCSLLHCLAPIVKNVYLMTQGTNFSVHPVWILIFAICDCCPSSFHLQEVPGAAFSICLSGQWQTAAGLTPSLSQAKQLLSMQVLGLESLGFWFFFLSHAPHGLLLWGICTLKLCLPPGAFALLL